MILKKQILFFGIGLLVLSCNRFNGPEKPKDLISKEKMVNILIDSRMLSSASSKNKRVMNDHNVDISTYVFKTNNIDSLQFAKSNSYYAFHMDLYEEIYEKVIDSLEKLNIKLKGIEADEWKAQTKREEDSLLQSRTSVKEIDTLKSVNPLKEKDTIDVLKLKDSLKTEILKNRTENPESLVKPISDIDFQQ